VTGATGYVGGRLVPELLAAGHQVRVMVRSPDRVRERAWAADVEIAKADATDAEEVAAALQGIDVAYYLLHSIASGDEFERTEHEMASTFASAADSARVRRIVYLGGLTPPEGELSQHLASRHAVGELFLKSAVPAAYLRAAVIIGSGSASFEMLRYLTERLPAMVTPRWVSNEVQPIAIHDVLRYLVGTASLPHEVNRSFDIGGPDVLTYGDMMQRYARIAGLQQRAIVPLPVLSPRLSSLWVGLVTPVPGSIARPLVESLRHPAVCAENDIATYVPDPSTGLTGFDQAVELALTKIQDLPMPTAVAADGTHDQSGEPQPTDPDWSGGDLFVEERADLVDAPVTAVWRVVESIGGQNGWYSPPFAWTLRSYADRASGGPGLQRGRRDSSRFEIGDLVDWWRVEELDDGRFVRLRSEVRMPGIAWLEFEARDEDGATILRQRTLFHPRGLAGHAYWWSLKPLHSAVFATMHRNMVHAAERVALDLPS
jgi:uncharacterized protein YbjT (DUF2867 family)